MCDTDPGFPVSVWLETEVPTLTHIWMGDMSWSTALRDEVLSLTGDRAAFVVSFGMSMNAMLLRNGVSDLSDPDPGWWTLVWMVPWAALSLLAAAWPPEASRPWPLFTRSCRAAVARVLSGETPETRFSVSRGGAPPAPAGVCCRL
ncbi:hypothetical protein [Streptomyces sp. V4I2]|uniref:hypothetical protein n=1 Tax=Streptomyces sp. V4I2 TaxID=3042280 RepID=UPI002787DAA5|nr:hypothetical protein [Streptomyces sp. V4I2]MDQ1051036.1 hypothetical protein [Streptomyces sp. V4I2]